MLTVGNFKLVSYQYLLTICSQSQKWYSKSKMGRAVHWTKFLSSNLVRFRTRKLNTVTLGKQWSKIQEKKQHSGTKLIFLYKTFMLVNTEFTIYTLHAHRGFIIPGSQTNKIFTENYSPLFHILAAPTICIFDCTHRV